jgi:hypothetical protein
MGAVLALAATTGRAEPIVPGAPEPTVETVFGTNGIWAGRELGSAPDAWVTLDIRGATMVLTDGHAVWVGTSAWKVGGPGTKSGALDLDVTLKLQAAVTLNGRPSRVRAGQKSALRVRLDPQGAGLAFCMTPPGSPAARPSSATDALQGRGIRCFELQQIATAPASPRVLRPPPEPDFECMRECRQQNMARAVSADQIDADCRRACAPR